MQGRDKGLVTYQGLALAGHVLQTLSPQCASLRISANRNLSAYGDLLAKHQQSSQPAEGVYPDDPALPAHSGPLAGILTALKHTPTDWLFVAPCDTPHLPPDIVAKLMAAAMAHGADVVTPCTPSHGPEPDHHWACALIHKRVSPQTEAMFVSGERKLRVWAHALPWCSVSFDDTAVFDNFNTLEALHGRE
jgi:molybdopterin-guanine dinucleotide biosynthesis protein A